MKYVVIANIPDQDHNAAWYILGETDDVTGYQEIRRKEIEFWKDTSNYYRLQQEGRFAMIKRENLEDFMKKENITYITDLEKTRNLK